jgi:hypothetical protein
MIGGEYNEQQIKNIFIKHKKEIYALVYSSNNIKNGGSLTLHYNNQGELVKFETRQINKI